MDEFQVWSLYFIRCAAGPMKVGRSTDVENRLRDLQVGNPFPLLLMASFVCGPVELAKRAESFVHRKLDRFSMRGEWFGDAAEPFVRRAIDVLNNRARGESVNDALLHGDWSGDWIDEVFRKSEARRAARIARAAAAAAGRPPPSPRAPAPPRGWLWRGRRRFSLPTVGQK